MEVNEFIDRFVKDPGLNSIFKGFASQFVADRKPCQTSQHPRPSRFSESPGPDEGVALARIVSDCFENARDKGFWSSRHPAEAIALIHSELSELLEAFRLEEPPFDIFNVMSEKKELGNIPLAMEELADVAIRVFDMAGRYFEPEKFARVILDKMNYNKTRPYKHGKSF